MNNNFLKLHIGLGILLFTSAMSYYFVFFLPKTEREKYTQEQIQKCSQDGEKLYSKIINEVEKEGNVLAFDHEYYFNKKLKTCLLSYGYTYNGVVIKNIIDVYTNKDIITFGMTNKKEWGISNDEFQAKYKELFSE